MNNHQVVYVPPKGYDLPDRTLTFTYFSTKGENLFLDKLENVHVFTEDELKAMLKSFVDVIYAPYNALSYEQKISSFIETLKSHQ